MPKSIERLIPDIYDLLKKKEWFNAELSQGLSTDIASRLSAQLGANTRTPTLRMSQLGPRCPKALWHSINTPELEGALQPWAEIKYSLGHIVEGLAVALAKASGHEVTGEQDELVLDGIVGHRDCVIDGYIVDVKSASSPSFDRFKRGTFTDTFGYLDQLDGYMLASANDPLVKYKRIGFDLVIDKQLGHMCLYRHEVTDERESTLRARIGTYKEIVKLPTPPPCECQTITDSSTGNCRLDLRASYSAFKHICFPQLRTALYAGGPVFFTNVVKWPWNKNGPLKEVDKHGRFVYN